MSFTQAMQAAGLRPRDVFADGKWRRCPTDEKPKKRNGAYLLSIDGRRGWFRDWADPLGGVIEWREEGAPQYRPGDAQRIERHRQAERDKRIAAIRAAQAFWRSAGPFRGHAYISDKGLSAQGCAGLRIKGGLLVVPVFHGDVVLSVQTIDVDGKKLFWPGAPVKGGAYVLDRPGAALTAICEGFATGLALYQMCRTARVVVAFDAGNITPVVQRLKPSGSVVLCADNDHGTQARSGINPGIQAARNAAELLGAGITWPDGIEGTDFADAARELGPAAARQIERQVIGAARYVMRL